MRSETVEVRSDRCRHVGLDRLLQGLSTEGVAQLKTTQDDILVGDLVLLEILQGAKDARHASRLETQLRQFEIARMLDEEIAVQAAKNYRTLRGLGWTVRTSADLVIATFCLREGLKLLHDDRDFAPFEHHLGLRCL